MSSRQKNHWKNPVFHVRIGIRLLMGFAQFTHRNARFPPGSMGRFGNVESTNTCPAVYTFAVHWLMNEPDLIAKLMVSELEMHYSRKDISLHVFPLLHRKVYIQLFLFQISWFFMFYQIFPQQMVAINPIFSKKKGTGVRRFLLDILFDDLLCVTVFIGSASGKCIAGQIGFSSCLTPALIDSLLFFLCTR